MNARQIERAFKLEVERHYKRGMTKEEEAGIREIVATYKIFDQLRREGRDSVWTYVARNLSRPLALSFGDGWANVVVGNPPWVAFRHMSADLQKRFRELAKGERVYVGGKLQLRMISPHCSRYAPRRFIFAPGAALRLCCRSRR
jgi:hypothetical protein